MRFLLDNCVSPVLKQPLQQAGHDVEHVSDVGLGKADDPVILDYARREDRVVITQDRDFSAALATSGADRPSLVYLRLSDPRPANHLHHLLTHLPLTEADLRQGAIVVITDAGVRVRPLPIP